MSKKRAILLILAPVVIIAVLIYLPAKTSAPPYTAEVSNEQVTIKKPEEFDAKKYSIDDPTSTWVVVNKKRPLQASYVPDDLTAASGTQMRAEAAQALQQLLQESLKNGHPLQTISAYRSYEIQAVTYNNYVARDGVAQADAYSARPGYSEHQTGLAVDLGNGTCDLEICFGDTPAGKWLAANAHEHGFIIRYQNGKNEITGYQYEPWHLRYTGKELSKELYTTGQALEEFFGLPHANH